jgi:hypothetical protein
VYLHKEVIGPCELYLGDCRTILPTLAPVDVVITDPPYSGLRGGMTIKNRHLASVRHATVTVGAELGTPAALPLIQDVARYGAIVFSSYLCLDACIAALGGKRLALVVWHKHNSMPPAQNVPWQVNEYAWVVQYRPGITWHGLRTHYAIPMLQAGCIAGERIVCDGKAVHPAQKPLALMEALLCPGMQTVCDPYMGLGTTGLACLKTGRAFVGIEIEEKYFRIAVRRIEEAYKQLTLFPVQPTRPVGTSKQLTFV